MKSSENGGHGWLAAAGLMLLPIVCCALPVLIAAGGFGVVGAVLRNPYVVGAALLILLGLVGWAVRRRVKGKGGDCPHEARTELRHDN